MGHLPGEDPFSARARFPRLLLNPHAWFSKIVTPVTNNFRKDRRMAQNPNPNQQLPSGRLVQTLPPVADRPCPRPDALAQFSLPPLSSKTTVPSRREVSYLWQSDPGKRIGKICRNWECRESGMSGGEEAQVAGEPAQWGISVLHQRQPKRLLPYDNTTEGLTVLKDSQSIGESPELPKLSPETATETQLVPSGAPELPQDASELLTWINWRTYRRAKR
jgi:hypothetical protein